MTHILWKNYSTVISLSGTLKLNMVNYSPTQTTCHIKSLANNLKEKKDSLTFAYCVCSVQIVDVNPENYIELQKGRLGREEARM